MCYEVNCPDCLRPIRMCPLSGIYCGPAVYLKDGTLVSTNAEIEQYRREQES